ncbi:hypothetical protein BDV36DRAFT_36453 [Aspergillus pseudocaelatus]|uniref:Uncharacterized protein n=1 Tax=Aspergillus pseudocaelatus TaxID=1825620 RepID=A0ABQ6W8F2_9EURO|nr:hypothetical protein BDV36DRAFT_36453 [Aspergillus pseudocaelatus]
MRSYRLLLSILDFPCSTTHGDVLFSSITSLSSTARKLFMYLSAREDVGAVKWNILFFELLDKSGKYFAHGFAPF